MPSAGSAGAPGATAGARHDPALRPWPVEPGTTLRRVKIYSSRDYLPTDSVHATILFPFWGRARGGEQWPGFADDFIARGGEFLELTGLADCDLAVFPENWKQAERTDGVGRLHAFAAEARAAGKPVAVFFEGDSAEPFPVPDVTVFRTSLSRSRRTAREFALPGFHDDLLDHVGGRLPVREKTRRPVVGFCGVALREERPRRAAVRRALARDAGPHPQDVFVRARALEALVRQRAVDVSIVLRGEGGGGAMYPTVDEARWPQVRREYVENLVASDYALCARGVGNWSWRLYEALSLGRIPVFVDTDCVLPYDFLVDWRAHCVWVDRADVERIGELVAGFHERLSPSGFAELQHRCRRLWEEYLRPAGFFASLHRHFPARA